ncbi:MAG TPA: N-6 DNA methylase, partial [Catalimonadaceae bacterium]|nr:N-6 DNA methylase [Catalimonadaceae bacterium]
RNREKEILFMDLRELGEPFEKKYTQFSAADIEKISTTYHNWQTAPANEFTSERFNIPEFCYAATIEEVAAKDFSLVPSKYIAFVNRDENIDFDEKMESLRTEFARLLKEEESSRAGLLKVFKELGYAIEL